MRTLALGLALATSLLAETAIHVCVNAGNGTSVQVLKPAEALTSSMFADAGVSIAWHSGAACRMLPRAETVVVDFVSTTLSGHHSGALAYSQVYEAIHIVVFTDRVENAARHSSQMSNLIARESTVLAHVMTHEIAHLLEGIARHSQTGVMKARWSNRDFDLMGRGPLPFAPEDLLLIQLGLARRADAAQ